MAEIKPVVMQKHELEFRVETTLVPLFESFDCSSFWCTFKTISFPIRCSRSTVRFPSHTLMDEVRVLVCEKFHFEERNVSKIADFIAKFWTVGYLTWIKTIGFLFKSSSTSEKFSDQAPMEEVRPVAVDKNKGLNNIEMDQ